jgi:hypothetical protein
MLLDREMQKNIRLTFAVSGETELHVTVMYLLKHLFFVENLVVKRHRTATACR